MYSNVRSTNYQAKLIGRLVRVSVTLIQKIPSKYMNTAWAKKTNVTNFTTAQHSLRCRFFYAHTALTTIQHFLFTPTQHSLRCHKFYADTALTTIIHSLIFHPRT